MSEVSPSSTTLRRQFSTKTPSTTESTGTENISRSSEATVAKTAIERFLRPLGKDVEAACAVCTFDDLRNSVYSLERLVKRKQERAPRILRQSVPILATIEEYSDIFSIFAQTNSLFLAPLWGSIRLLVLVLRSYLSYIDDVLGILNEIRLQIPRYHEYVTFFPDKARLVRAVTSSYLLVVEFCVTARSVLLSSGKGEGLWNKLKRRTYPIWRPGHVFKDIMDEIKSKRDQIESEAKAAGLHTLVQLRADGEEQYKALNSMLSDETHCREMDEICRWLRNGQEEIHLVTQERLKELSNAKYPGTCQWLFEKVEYVKWLSRDRGIMLVHGAPGCGKSVLAATCVQKFLDQDSESSSIYFFCDQRSPIASKWEFVIRSWAVQIVRGGLSEEQHKKVLHLIRDKRYTANDMDTLRSIIYGFLQKPVRFVVLDGLDELVDIDQAISELQKMAPETKILVFSRGERSILEGFPADEGKGFHNITIKPEDTQGDIEAHVSGWTDEQTRLPRKLAAVAKEILFDRANGMFLWICLMLKELEGQMTEEEFLRTLETKSAGLDGYFSQFLSRLQLSPSPSYLKYTKLMLQLAVFSADTLTVESIAQALAFATGSQEAMPVFDARGLIERCSPLFQIHPSGQVQAVHLSIVEYLRTKPGALFEDSIRDIEAAGHSVLFGTCVRFLLCTLRHESTAVVKQNPFLKYATRHTWTHLFKSGLPNSEKLKLLIDFFQNSDNGFLWVEITSLFGIDFRLQDQLRIQSGLRNWLKNYKPASPSDVSMIQHINGGLRSLHVSAVEYSMKKYGKNNIRTAKTTHALASFIHSNGNAGEALPYYENSLSQFKASEGFDASNPDYLTLLAHLADCQIDIEPMNPDGEKNMRLAYEGSMSVRGDNHPETLHNGVMLAETWRQRKEYDKSISLFLYIVNISTEILGPEHMTTLRGHHNLGKAFMEIGEFKEAEENLELAASRRRKLFGLNNQSTIRSTICLGDLYCKKGDYNKASQLITDGLNGLKSIHGPKNHYVYLATESLGDVLFQKGDFNVALDLYREALDGMATEYGRKTTRAVRIIDKFAQTYCQVGNPWKAERLMAEGELTRTEIMGVFHPDTIENHRRLTILRGDLKRKSLTSAGRCAWLNLRDIFSELFIFRSLVLAVSFLAVFWLIWKYCSII